MKKTQLLQSLKSFKDDHSQEYGIERIGIFGSYARDAAKPDSDVDIVVHLAKHDSAYLTGIKKDLEQVLQLPVDLVGYRKYMNTFLKTYIDREAEYI